MMVIINTACTALVFGLWQHDVLAGLFMGSFLLSLAVIKGRA